MRVLAVTPYYEPEGGGLEQYAHAVLSRLAARGHAVRVLAFTARALGNEGRSNLDIRRRIPRWRLSNTPIDPGFARVCTEEIRAFHPDVIVAHTPVPFPAEMASLAASRAGVPFVVTYHAGQLQGGAPLLDALAAVDRATLERRMLARSAGLIAVSDFVRDNALRRHAARVRIIPPGVDGHLFRPADPPADPRILFVGPLDGAYRWKGVDVLWEAFRAVRRELPATKLTLVGTGDRLPEFRQRAAAEGLGKAVEFPGRLSASDLVKTYQTASVVALPSTSPAESFGMVLAEANACGRPVVGSRVGGIPCFVRPGDNGLLAAPGDPHSLAEALLRILRNSELAAEMGARGRARVLREHNWDDLARATEGALKDAALATPRPRSATRVAAGGHRSV